MVLKHVHHCQQLTSVETRCLFCCLVFIYMTSPLWVLVCHQLWKYLFLKQIKDTSFLKQISDSTTKAVSDDAAQEGSQRGDFNIRIHIFTIYTLYFYFLETFPKIMREKSKYKYYNFYTCCFMSKKNKDILDVFLVCIGMKKADVEWTFSGTQS